MTRASITTSTTPIPRILLQLNGCNQVSLEGRRGPMHSAVQMNSYTDNELQTFNNLNVNTNDFPTYLLKTSYLFYGYQTSTTGQSSIFVNGDLITYNYPMGLVNSEYNLLYSSNGAMIYGPCIAEQTTKIRRSNVESFLPEIGSPGIRSSRPKHGRRLRMWSGNRKQWGGAGTRRYARSDGAGCTPRPQPPWHRPTTATPARRSQGESSS